MALNRDQIIKADDLRHDEVDMTKEWGGVVKVRSLTAKQQVELFKEQGEKGFNQVTQMVAMCCVDDDGNLLFDDTPEGREIIGAKDPDAVLKLYQGILKINNMHPEAVDELAKN